MIPDLALCAPDVAPEAIAQIIQIRSNSQPYALNVHNGLKPQPTSLDEAVAKATATLNSGNAVDVGVMQINSDWWRPMGYSLQQMYDPCTNIAVGMSIIKQQLQPHTDGGRITAKEILPFLIHQESRGHHFAAGGGLLSSPVGALGITQVMPTTAKNPGYGITPLRDSTEYEYMRFGQDYLQAMLNQFGGNVPLALAAYNAGEGNVRSALKKQERTGMSWLLFAPKETQNYVAKISTAMLGNGAYTQPVSDVAQVPSQSYKRLRNRKSRTVAVNTAVNVNYTPPLNQYTAETTTYKAP